ncbi:MAG: methionine--tRNA ligase [Cryobacterium sp.]|nr:methionine--tRNA ligase [Oligoflexia bacterium]
MSNNTKQLAADTPKYVTTAIVYPNSRIHIGWAWECIATDWLARGYRALGFPTRFVTGMDEHSSKVAKAGEAKGLGAQEYCDQMAEDIRTSLGKIDVAYDRFIRTSDADHKRVVSRLVGKAFERGDIYKNRYEGYYCDGCEAFYLDKDLVEGKCPHHGTAPKWIAEENYFFRLSKYQKDIEKLFAENPDFLQPANRRAEVLTFVREGLRDFSISRAGQSWGIPLPFDEKHVVYVWFDALLNYITAANYDVSKEDGGEAFRKIWPASVHVIGKDITRFHAVYWPAMLMALDLPLPKKVFAHGWMNLKGDRMSKSSGNVVSPDDVLAIANSDQLRYYLLAENEFSGDGNFAYELLILKVNADLANDWGNLVNRTINMTRKYFPGESLDFKSSTPNGTTHSTEIRESFAKLPGELLTALDSLDPKAYAQACAARSRILNLYIDRMKPWALAKTATPESLAELREVLYTLMEGIRHTAAGFRPLLPNGMLEVFRQLNVPETEIGKVEWGQVGIAPGEPSPIYPRLEMPKDPETATAQT